MDKLSFQEDGRTRCDSYDDQSLLVPKSRKKAGLSLPVTIVFIAGYMAGVGVLALPRAVENTGEVYICRYDVTRNVVRFKYQENFVSESPHI